MRTGLLVCCLLAVSSITRADVSLPKNVQAAVDMALEVSLDGNADHERIVRKPGAENATYERFSQVMDALATQVPPALSQKIAAQESDSISAKLITIACYRRANPQMYQEVVEGFVLQSPGAGGRSNHMPPAPPALKVEKYRLLWEYLPLAPALPHPAAYYKSEIQNALSAIHNDASLLTVVQMFSYTVRPEMGEAIVASGGYQESVLATIGDFLGQHGLAAFLECSRLWHQKAHPHLHSGSLYIIDEPDVPEYIAEKMYKGYPSKRSVLWHEAVAVFAAHNTKPEYTELLHEIRTAGQDLLEKSAGQ